MNNIQELCINSLRFLSIDMIESAKSGHPGAPMGMATVAYTLWQRHLKHSPSHTNWLDRDRFILSAGHASALLYSLLHVYGYKMPMEELKRFRQMGSKTPGHPERDHEIGIETTTGPLGQGFANAVGIAMAERWLSGHFNQPGYDIINHYTYALVSDGDMMEGVAAEAASFAGTMGLGKLICLYDDNEISIEGSTDLTFTENVGERFNAYNWHVVGPIDGHNVEEIDTALKMAKEELSRPSMIVCKTRIGYGSPNKSGTASCHGEPLGVEEAELTRKNLGWPYPPFFVPDDAALHFRQAIDAAENIYNTWEKKYWKYKASFPAETAKLEMALDDQLPPGWGDNLENLLAGMQKPMATREVSGVVINELAKNLHNLVGGSADLAPSTKTILAERGYFSAGEPWGCNIHFGVREHAMGAVANGLSLHGGVIPYTATFLIFYDYMRPPVRLAALMNLGVTFIFTHDSIGLGEDGPTHQPIEQIMGLRLVPDLVTLRPCDATETIGAWKVAINRRNGPTAIVLTRQKVPQAVRTSPVDSGVVQKGAYIIWEAEEKPDIIIIATGSEVHLAIEAGIKLKEQGVSARVVSMPSWELFDLQDKDYKELILPRKIKARISVEAGSTTGWQKYIHAEGLAIGIDQYGVSAPADEVYKHFGITVERIVEGALAIFAK